MEPAAVPRDVGELRGLRAVRLAADRLGLAVLGDEALVALAVGDASGDRPRTRRLLDELGGPSAIAAATPGRLRAAGVSPRAAEALAVGAELARRAAAAWPSRRWTVRAPADVGEPLAAAMGALEREELRVLLLDTKHVVREMRTVYVGNVAGSPVRIGEVFRDAVRGCAAAIVVVHNHPSGDPSPSGEDLRITAELASAGRLLDVELLDHVVVGRGRWVSLRAIGALDPQPATTR